jgi:NADPH-dependent glutamate synthase beta subunit-like oxidoreductase
MTIAVLIMGSLGLIVGIGLAFASKIFYVYVDPLIEQIEGALPGANCGGCGFPGCSANAQAIATGKSAPTSCVAAGPDVAGAIAALLGVSMEVKEPDIAQPGCTYGVKDADTKYVYDGLNDCRAVSLLSGGMKVCTIGCVGLGTCARACPFGAIRMGEKGLPVVNEALCTGCGTCERVCPKHIINLSSVTRRIIREYTTENCTTPCQRACPAGIDICEYIRQIGLGDYHRAVQVIKERNPFPAVIGRICPRPCENDCRRQLVDEPVAINFLKRFAADYERHSKKRVQPYRAPDTGRKVAVVGGGVEGLATAFFMARLGHAPTVFEATDQLGGLLRSAISAQRLPAEIFNWDIDGILEMGVAAELGKSLGKNIGLAELLQQDYQAIFLASGGWDSRQVRGGGFKVESPIPGTYLLLDFMRSAEDKQNGVRSGAHAVLAGGGELALKAARMCKAKGAETVTLLTRDFMEDLPAEFNLDDLNQEGIVVHCASGITRLFGEDDRLAEIEVMDLCTRQKQRLAADTVLFAAGRFPELIVRKRSAEAATGEDSQSQTVRWEGFPPYKQPAYAAESGLFAVGDPVSDFSGAIRAIGAGRRAAVSIHKSLYEVTLDLPDTVLTLDSYVQNVDHVENVESRPRQVMPIANQKELFHGQEIEKGFDESRAKAEAARCLQCGLICYQHSAKDQPVQIQAARN